MMTVASVDDAIDSANYSNANNAHERCDNRMTSRGCAKRTRYSSRHKVDWLNEEGKHWMKMLKSSLLQNTAELN